MKVLLIGNPNVGKSVIFNRLSGLNVISSNYVGTTINFLKTFVSLAEDKKFELIDVPGTYTLKPTNEAEAVAVKILKEGDVIVNVIDATNLERNLFLTMQLISFKKPLVVILNMWDETKHKGIEIDVKKLSDTLGVPVIPVCALSGEGIKEFSLAIKDASVSSYINKSFKKLDNLFVWDKIGKIISDTQKLYHHHHTVWQRISDFSIHPILGLFFAFFVLYVSFITIRFIGEGLIGYFFNPFFQNVLTPFFMKLSSLLGSGGFLHQVLIGRLVDGQIDYFQSFGVLTSGFYVPIVAVLPYVISFYFVLSILEDSGYLPRLAVLIDNVFHKLGLHGYAIIPTLLGFGCNVPGILATRILEDKRQRFVVSVLISIAVPCVALQAMILNVLGKYGFKYVISVYVVLFIVWIIIGFILNKFKKGNTPELFIEIPPYRLPSFKVLFKKLYFRVKNFLLEALPIVLGGILLVNLLYSLNIFQYIANFTAPVITRLMGLPKNAVIAIIMGFLRKDIAMGMLLTNPMTLKQLFISIIILSMTFPCIATFAVLWKELGWKKTVYSVLIMLLTAIFVGSIINFIL
jgi:ferrous iron transport protein B